MDNKYLGLTPPMGWNSWNTFPRIYFYNTVSSFISGLTGSLAISELSPVPIAFPVIKEFTMLPRSIPRPSSSPDEACVVASVMSLTSFEVLPSPYISIIKINARI